MKVCIIQYNAGNIYSVVNALRRLGIDPILTDDAEELASADRILFPGQGEASTVMQYLIGHQLDKLIKNLRQPVLGICIGQQLLCQHSEEGDTDCIGIFPVDVKHFPTTNPTDKIPAVGWNYIESLKTPLFEGLEQKPYTYFLHSYYVPISEWTIATANYILPFSAAMHKDNFWSTQFHPEKSGDVGERILKNFLDLQV
ncbi:MAG: imidazole glycerol phosphate synthase subunit HisH [Prevotella sp.]